MTSSTSAPVPPTPGTSSAREQAPLAPTATGLDRIDLHSDASVEQWTRRLDVTTEQLKEAIEKVGDRATDVELHLKGSRSTSNEKTTSDARPTDPEQARREQEAAERPLKNA